MDRINIMYSLREWTPLNLNELIPPTIKNGFFSTEVIFTCIGAIPKYLAIGSNVGIVFWYNRETGEVQKLHAEKSSRITCVKIVDSVEYMVAAGSDNGQVSVFRIQKPLPPDLHLVAPCTRLKPVQRYTVRDLHRTPITACEWSKNGMKLYSGDREGIVVLTEINYQTHISKSWEILCEGYEIVQLSVDQSYLLVSTLYRAIVCQLNKNTGQWHVTQVGKKDREQLVDCGGLFLKGRDKKNPLLILGRPGLEFWFADTEGNVEKVLNFHDAFMQKAWEIPILNPKIPMHLAQNETNSMGKEAQNLRIFQLYFSPDTLIITHDEVSLYLLNIDRLRVEARARSFRKILDFCACGEEVFVLEGERSVIRLAPAPEKPKKRAQIIFNPLLPPPVPVLGAAAAGAFESPIEYEPEEQKIINAEECFEFTPIGKLNLNVSIELAVESPRSEQNRRFQIFNQISQVDLDQKILHRSGLLINGRKNRKSKSSERRKETVTGIVEIGHVVKTNDDKETVDKFVSVKTLPAEQIAFPTFMDASFCASTLEENTVNKSKPFTLDLIKNPINYSANTHISPISPIAAEEFERAQSLAASSVLKQSSAASFSSYRENKSPISKLDSKLPRQLQQKDVEVQTMPCNEPVYVEVYNDLCDYSAGQPIDDICPPLRATTLIEDTLDNKPILDQSKESIASNATPPPLQFVTSQPIPQDISSFIPDFRRIHVPSQRSPPPSGDSGTSSEWEFLDN